MSFQLTSTTRTRASRPAWANVAFIVEAMVLLVFLIASLAVFMQLFSAALERSEEGGTMTGAVAAASTTAERFAADPQGVPAVAEFDDLVVTCDVTPEARDRGTLYHANIAVYRANEAPDAPDASAASTAPSDALDALDEPGAVYAISTSVYVSGVR